MTTSTADHATEADVRAIVGTIQSRLADARRTRGWSFDQLAATSGVSKGTLVQIEQGKANPSIAILCRVASALSLSVADLIRAGDAPAASAVLIATDASRRLWNGPQGGAAVLLAGCEGPDMLELWEWTLHPGERYEAEAHTPGTRELLRIMEGAIELHVDGERHVIAAGASVSARTDRPHAYACSGEAPARFSMVVFEPRAPSPSEAVRSPQEMPLPTEHHDSEVPA